MNRATKKSRLSKNLLLKKEAKTTCYRDYAAKFSPLGFIVPLAVGYIFAPSLIHSVRASIEDSPKTVVDQVWQIVNHEYVGKNFNRIDWEKKRQELLSRSYTNNKQAYRAIREALKVLGDPYTRFLAPAELEILTNQTTGELSGIGIRMTIDSQTSHLTVVESLENTPASKAGIKAGDRITKINGKPTTLMTLEQASEDIRGKTGTKVTLEISREGKELLELTLTRAQIELLSVSYTLKQEGPIQVGYIKLDEFNSHSGEQMKKAIRDLQAKGVESFVLDLRGNPGGLLFASVDIARMWMRRGTIVHMIDRKGGDREFSANGTALTNLPLVVLVDENSASASEILAGALKDNGRATIVGSRTYGKGTVQSVHSLSDGSGLVLTISRYYPPSRININKHGIAPDIEEDLTQEEQLLLRSNPSLVATNVDPQYQRAIAILKQQPNTSRLPSRERKLNPDKAITD